MGAMIIPLAVVLVAGLIVLGLVVADRYPISTWPARIRHLVQDARQEEEPVEVVPQEVRLSDLMTREGPSAYTRTDSFEGLVSVVDRALDTAEKAKETAGIKAQELEARRQAARRAKAQVPQHSRPIEG
ncbi:hypothetical protein J5X07_02140 [Actinomyces bowdenii]|uniref:Uncharacterized protein n=2 Tax=Actinomyces bowdenii TaxID=131109 RepID=A0A3P1VBI8_9ACTO|nr:hypothetical protein [Actinomyces bowdenii]MBO3723844.1 hypothetical protein [Actinomyces bowdenii]RRD29933.1 hypothetical protein EII10_04350 [Actinomyces bowdenii]